MSKPKKKVACLDVKQVKRLEQQIWDLKMEIMSRTSDLTEGLWKAVHKAEAAGKEALR